MNNVQVVPGYVPPPPPRWTATQVLAFQRVVARVALTKMAGWTAVPEFVAAVGECDRQITLHCGAQGITREQFYEQYHQYQKEKPL